MDLSVDTGVQGEPMPARGLALLNGRIILPERVVAGQALVVRGGRIVGLCAEEALPAGVECLDVGGRYVASGLIDIHTHGAVGHTFNDGTPQAIAAIASEQARAGVTSLLPTIAGAAIPAMLGALEACRQWLGRPQPGAQPLGVHIEGPYFSPAQRGAQDLKSLRTPSDGSVDSLLEYGSIVRMMSYAPELPGALELTARLARLGIVPAAGHSGAQDVEVRAAIKQGLCHAIHLWSGQSTTVREGPWRKPGLLEASLVYDELSAEIIADNRHLPPTLMALAYRCKGADRLCAVSDASAGAGLPEGAHFRLGEIEYDVQDGVGMVLDRSAFAGSVVFLNRMVPILRDVVGIPLVEAVRMVSLTPARIIGCAGRKGSLEAGKDADLAIFEEDFTAWRVMIGGRWAHVRAR